MDKVILQPSGSADAKQHFGDTIASPVPLSRLEQYFDGATIAKLRTLYPSGATPVWGVVPGDAGRNIKKWERVDVGDVVLFAGGGRIFASAVVTAKARSLAAATELWGTDANGSTWEFMYFLDEVTRQDIPYRQFNAAAGYAENMVVQGFVVVSEERSAKILKAFNLLSSTHLPPVTVEAFDASVRTVDSEVLDANRITAMRTEQTFLRRVLFGGNVSAECCICGESFPVEFLVASHIKKRCFCSDEEKRDATNIVAPMCSFGCDDLFERGYVGVVDGVITQLKPAPNSPPVRRKVSIITGRRCSRWGDGTRGYFRWHARHHVPVKSVP